MPDNIIKSSIVNSGKMTTVSQRGNAPIVFILLLLGGALAAAGYFYFSENKPARVSYTHTGVTKVHGVIHWERSNIPAQRIVIAMYARPGNAEKRLAELDTGNIGYYQFEDFDTRDPVFFKVYRKDKKTARREMLLQTRPVLLTRGRSKYLPIYLPSTRERLADGYKDKLEGYIEVSNGRLYFNTGDDLPIRLSGAFLPELKKLKRYLLVLKGEYISRQQFRVYDYHVQEIDNGERPLMGNLIYKSVDGRRRFYIQGERDGQLLYLPANYRLFPQLKRSIGARVMVTGPVEQDGVKPLTFEVVSR